ncbi:MAG: hypothetical protein K0R51_3151 [Cytophagaceae bacterium]|jgi:hypothetical protein|nr:hypothetical protein [Cytophagaceae bacterium]
MKTQIQTEQKIKTAFGKIAKEYGEQFISERLPFYLLDILSCTDTNEHLDYDAATRIALNLHGIRHDLLTFFDRTKYPFNDASNVDYNREKRHDLQKILGLIIQYCNIRTELNDDYTRRDVDFLLDLISALD